jgi:hypothetical protein
MVKTLCLNCQTDILFGENPQMGQRAICPACHTVFEVVWLFPLELDWLSEPDLSTPGTDRDLSSPLLAE